MPQAIVVYSAPGQLKAVGLGKTEEGSESEWIDLLARNTDGRD